MIIQPMTASHGKQVLSIYEAGIATGNATFQTAAPSWEEWDQSHLQVCRLVAVEGDKVLGWAALTAVSSRCVYAGVAEVSVYIAPDERNKGVGRQLLEKLISESEQHNIWTLQAGIFPENTGSVKLHESCGFRMVGRRERIGKMGSTWRDTVLLERRSTNVGV
ncbi:phosphinothricin acetyltransferase [Chitinophaga jiangningensis]|uniref:Phosphinothricin acetyltransferase n=1 Tax=Chitinophaga jiangningensis TaxID=1419482 RepID=A0A1M7IXT4_9BACT|nr:GNAT family N-acetyltransferase [Chitinophaga jiangningensis]SHM45508.1 phosphinothricin acetyltransferase [Chitinophaga jiangningensis]